MSSKYEQLLKHMSLVIAVGVLSSLPVCAATTYYVSPSGSDTSGTGSSGSPWATLSKAASSVPTNQGNIIHMVAGTYLMTTAVWIPVGSTLEGENTSSDATKTVILTHQTGYPGYVVNVSTGNAETSPGGIRNITFDGDNYTGVGGVNAQKISNFTVNQVTFQHLNGPGLRLDWTGNGSVTPAGYENNNEVEYCTFIQNKGFAIGGEAWSGFLIHDNFINYADVPNASLSNPSPWGDGINVFWCKSTRIYNNTIIVPNYTPKYAFPQQQTADTITIFHGFGGNEIDHNELAQWVTLVGSETLDGYSRIMSLHDNHIYFTQDVAGPGVEIMFNDSEIYNNYIDNAEVGILTDPGAVTAGNHASDVTNMRIHGNVFRRTNSGALYEGYGIAFRNSTNTTANNWSIYNNVFDGYDYGFQLDGGGFITNLNAKNNVLLNCRWIINWGSNDPISNSSFTNNIWHFINGFDRNAAPNFTTANIVIANNLPGAMTGLSTASGAGLFLSGGLPSPYYTALSSSSIVVDGGTTSIAPGITLSGYSGNAPDIGAYEFGGTGTPPIPSPPTGLTATSGNTQVSLAWASSSGATSYNVYRGTNSGGEGTTAIATGITTTSYTNTGLTNGTTYYYKVAAVNTAGTSGLSNEASATPAMSGLIDRTNETGGTIQARGDNAGTGEGKAQAFDNNINTKWLDFSATSWISYQFASSAAYVITEYKVTSGNDTASSPGRALKSWVLKGSNDGTTWTTLDTRTNVADTANLDTKVYDFANSTAYKIYKLDNIVSNGDAIIQMSELRLLGPSGGGMTTVATPTFSPAGGTYTSTQSVTLSDSTSGAAIHYTTDGSTPTASSTTYNSAISVNATTTIKAIATASGYANSAVASATYTINIVTLPSAPTGLTATSGNTQVSLAWASSSGATSYNVYRGTSSGGESTTAIATGITTTSYTNTGLTNGTAYYYTVKAVNASGTSGASNEASATPSAGGSTVTVNDNTTGGGTNQFSYTGGWFYATPAPGTGAYNNDDHETNNSSWTATLTFTGTKVTLYSQTGSNFGTMAVSIDGGTATNVNLHAGTTAYPLVFTSATLASGAHTMKVRPVSGFISVDKAVIYP